MLIVNKIKLNIQCKLNFFHPNVHLNSLSKNQNVVFKRIVAFILLLFIIKLIRYSIPDIPSRFLLILLYFLKRRGIDNKLLVSFVN